MKKLKFALLLTLLTHLTYGQLVNDGATITIKNGATLFVESDVQNNSTGTISIESGGVLEIQGDLVNAGTATLTSAGTGKLKFSGASNSELSTGGDALLNLEVAKTTSTLTLLQPATVNTNLDFGTGTTKLVLGAHNLTLGSATTITDASSTAYIVADAAGMVQRVVTANGAFTYPIGDATNYSPITSTYTGSAYSSANIKANITKYADLAGHPSKPATAESFLERTWNVDQTGITGYNNSLVGTYVPADVNGTEALIKGAVYDGTQWSYSGAARSGLTVSGTTNDALADFTGTNFYGKVDMKMFLAGPYNITTNEMVTSLNAPSGTNWLETSALSSPYNAAPYSAEAASVSTGFFLANPDIVDWVMLELRDPSAPSTTTTNRSSAFLKKDGSIVGLSGSGLPTVENGLPTSVVAIHHRNHLTFRTKNVGTNVAEPTLIDFRTDTTQVFKTNIATNVPLKLAEVAPNGFNSLNSWAMWDGDVVKDGVLKYNLSNNDRAQIYTAIGGASVNATITGYRLEDVNMDGIVKYNLSNNDRAIIYTNIGGASVNATITSHN